MPLIANRIRPFARVLPAAIALVGLGPVVLGGCSRVMTSSGVRMQSTEQPARLEPRVVSSGYRWRDASTADIYISDIPMQELAAADSLEDLSGSIVRIHMFLRPKPGKTPIETTASSVTIHCAVLARGEVGLYGGGGFLFPAGTPGDASFGGSIEDGSVRLLAATPGFLDQLGAAEFEAGVVAPENESAAAIMDHLLEHASRVARGEATASGG